MNWDAIAALAELISSIAVLITIVYLAIQVRQANISARSNARATIMHSGQMELYQIINNPEIHDAMALSEELSHEQKVKLHHWLIAFLRQREEEWLQQQDGTNDSAKGSSYKTLLLMLFGSPRVRSWWENVGNAGFDPDFVKEIEDAISSSVLSADEFTARWEKWS